MSKVFVAGAWGALAAESYTDAGAEWFTSGWDDDAYDVESDD